MKAYIATSLSRATQHNLIRDAISARGHELTYDWTEHGSLQAEGEDRISAVAQKEIDGVREADAVIVLLPGGRGTHTELGAALALGLRVILHSERKEDLLKDGKTCAFYLHPLVTQAYGPFGIATQIIPDALDAIQEVKGQGSDSCGGVS